MVLWNRIARKRGEKKEGTITATNITFEAIHYLLRPASSRAIGHGDREQVACHG